MPEHLIYIVFFFLLGACVGSFLNVVVWRLPRGESLVTPPSHCPNCDRRLLWYDNVPIVGWLKLRGKCRFCGQPISPRYPLVETFTALLFAGYYVLFFLYNVGPCPQPGSPGGGWLFGRTLNFTAHWPIYALYITTLCVLLAASLIDAELYQIPLELLWGACIGDVEGKPWWRKVFSYFPGLAPAAVVWHAIIDRPTMPGNLNASPAAAALAAGGGIGLLITLVLWLRGVIPTSFAEEMPLMEIEKEELKRRRDEAKQQGKDLPPELSEEPKEFTRAELNAEMRKEMIFLMPPLFLAGLFAFLVMTVGPVGKAWASLTSYHWFSGLLGSVLGMLVGGFVVWLTRILGTMGFGREAMGIGDVHLMAAVGAVIGAGASTVAFFIAPFCGLVLAIYLLFSGRKRELPYGPYLSMATAIVMLFYCPIAARLAPGIAGLSIVVNNLFARLFG